ncbi:hypothetical protein G6F32_016784 [Rhizopus arrhizus]|nr:hypothetical protein G6F32_016784 [Rhizopus arrhizus]
MTTSSMSTVAVISRVFSSWPIWPFGLRMATASQPVSITSNDSSRPGRTQRPRVVTGIIGRSKCDGMPFPVLPVPAKAGPTGPGTGREVGSSQPYNFRPSPTI